MATQYNKEYASEVNNWYNQLKSVRSRFNLGTVTVPTISSGDKVNSSTSSNINTLMNNAVTDHSRTSYMPHITKTVDFTAATGSKLNASTDTGIVNLMNTWMSSCVNQSVHGQDGEDGEACSHDGTCSFDVDKGESVG